MYKFTADGRKVAVIGALNAKETIVQEIFVTDGTEFPAGEHFVELWLLDRPAETYKAKEERRIAETIGLLEKEKKRVEKELESFQFKAKAATAQIKWLRGVTNDELRGVVENIKAMMLGEYTHVVLLEHSVKIAEWGPELFANSEVYSPVRFESLRLISMFGEWNGRLSLGWRANTYKDGSGSSAEFIPCRSFDEAVEKAKEAIYAKKCLSDDDYRSCLKYGIPVDEKKNAARIKGTIDSLQKRIAAKKEELVLLEAKLSLTGQPKTP